MAAQWQIGGWWGNVGVEIVEEGSGRQVAVVNRQQELRRRDLASKRSSGSEWQEQHDARERAALDASGDTALATAAQIVDLHNRFAAEGN